MATAPYGVRLLVGVAATAVEETRRLPQNIMMYPMTLASQVAHLVMKVQQDLADLVIKGDETLESIFPPRDEQPAWATFDEDEATEDGDREPATPAESGRMTEGRFALYSIPEPAEAGAAAPGGPNGDADASITAPAVAATIEYGSLTLAQLRARLQSLSVAELEELLAYEEASKARAPFQTLLANRITRASTK